MKTQAPLRTAVVDLETWDLSPEFGPVLVASVLCHDGTMRSFRQDAYLRKRGEKRARSMADDRALLADVAELLSEHHLLVGWHIKGFDLPLLRTRLALHGLPVINRGQYFVLDPMWYFRGWRGLKPKSSSLKSVAAYFGLDECKLDVTPQQWLQARAGDRACMDIAVERCESDVRLTAECTRRALDLGLGAGIQRYP